MDFYLPFSLREVNFPFKALHAGQLDVMYKYFISVRVFYNTKNIRQSLVSFCVQSSFNFFY